MALHRVLGDVTQRIIDRSRGPRQAYLETTRKNAGRRSSGPCCRVPTSPTASRPWRARPRSA